MRTHVERERGKNEKSPIISLIASGCLVGRLRREQQKRQVNSFSLCASERADTLASTHSLRVIVFGMDVSTCNLNERCY